MRSLNSFSHPYPSSGIAGYASSSLRGSTSGRVCFPAAYTHADEPAGTRDYGDIVRLTGFLHMGSNELNSAKWQPTVASGPVASAGNIDSSDGLTAGHFTRRT